MELTLRAAAPGERLYIARQSTQIEGQTGSVGHLRADMGEDGKGFFPKWTSHRENLDTEEFQQELECVMETLVGDEQYGGFLNSRDAMRDFCREYPESVLDHGLFSFGFRADTAQYAYLIQLHPYKVEGNLFIYCYRRDWLERHMEQAEKGIRFIDPHYKELFRIPDGGQIRILREGCAHIDKVCRYIDDCHVEVGNGWDSLFHICEFAEQMERCHNKVIPLTPPLPEKCFTVKPSSGELIVIERYKPEYQVSPLAHFKGKTPQQTADVLNANMGVTRAQAAAMLAGSMFGWTSPAADPNRYTVRGRPIKPKRHDRGDAR